MHGDFGKDYLVMFFHCKYPYSTASNFLGLLATTARGGPPRNSLDLDPTVLIVPVRRAVRIWLV